VIAAQIFGKCVRELVPHPVAVGFTVKRGEIKILGRPARTAQTELQSESAFQNPR
jgi:hypothetical protein